LAFPAPPSWKTREKRQMPNTGQINIFPLKKGKFAWKYISLAHDQEKLQIPFGEEMEK
jgi:hypothetical protein